MSPVPRARWRDELAQAQVPASLRPMKATLLALVPLMTTTGELYVWRDRMVKATGLPPRTLNHHLRQAGESGWLTRTVRGGNGRRSRYETALPCRSCEQRMAHNAGSCEQATRTQLPEVVSKFVAHSVSECERSERVLLPDGAGGAPPPAPPGPASLRFSGGADEKQDPFVLRRSPERSEWARGSGGQAAPRLPKPSARPVNATDNGSRAREGGVGGGGARPRPVHPKRRELGTCTWHPDQRTGSCGVCMKASADLRKRRPDVFCTQFHPAIRLDDNGHCLGCAYEGRYTPPDVEVTG